LRVRAMCSAVAHAEGSQLKVARGPSPALSAREIPAVLLGPT